MNQIRKILNDGRDADPVESILVVCIFGCHGILKDGVQNVVFNEFDKRSQYYKTLNIENNLRLMAETNPSAYIVSIFACCR